MSIKGTILALKVFYVFIPAFFFRNFFFRKKGMLMLYQSRSVVRLSARPPVTFLVNVFPTEPLDVATSNFVPG